ncbi:MAG: DUF2779 domain-containing protein [Planctomycetota bacterium]
MSDADTTKTSAGADDGPVIDKPLFEAGLQCSKRLYLEYHEPDSVPSLSAHREELSEVGLRLVELASQIFPGGMDLGEEDFDEALRKTEAFLKQGRPGVVFHAAFAAAGVEVRADIVLVTTPGKLDLFEVKAGSTVKPRHLADLAMQVHAIEGTGQSVQSCAIVHLDPSYVHDGSKNYPVQKLFKNVDVTARVQAQREKVFGRLQAYRSAISDEGSLDLPTGTWCKRPLPCHFLERCRAEGPDHPLVDLPQLNPDQESRLHEEGIESIDQIDATRAGFTPTQRRAIRAISESSLGVEEFVPRELSSLDRPVAFVHVGWHLEVLPRFPGTRPWHKIPYGWSVHWLKPDGSIQVRSYASRGAEDPRDECLESLSDQLAGAETVIVYSFAFEDRMRAMLEDDVPSKPKVRALTQLPTAALEQLLMQGVYHPEFASNFDLWNVHEHLTEDLGANLEEEIPGFDDSTDLEFRSESEAASAYRRMLKSRTRAATRKKLGDQLEAWCRHSSAALMRTVLMLQTAEPLAAEESSVPAVDTEENAES